MKLVLFVGFAGYATASVLERRACTADNCLRALTGSGSNDKASRPVIAKADCSSFLSTLVYATVTPSSVTTTTVVTTTVSSTSTTIQTAVATAEDVITVTTPSSTSTTSVGYATTYTTLTYTPTFLNKRTATESLAIPTYASACSGAVGYSSACSCVGVFPTTSTSTILVTPTVTATSTTTLTISVAETDTTTQTTTETTSTTLTAGVATATVGGIDFCGVVGRCQISNIAYFEHTSKHNISCQTFAVFWGGLSYSTDSNLNCYVYAFRIEDPACEFNPLNGGLSYDIDC